ncbi:MAG: glycogen synthase GlgA [Cetobacterium sp.]|uniref:glycogen synthase GlgA n=1 Tax=Cetobacterium sp. TaxID=2071632 RepID=UPI002FCA2D5E
MKNINLLFITSEADPFLKVGGLGDVSHALPKALKKIGVNVRVILPKNGNIPKEFTDKMKLISTFTVPVGWRNQYAGLFHLEFEGIDFYFLDNEYYFKRHIPYGHYDDGEIFSFFCRGVLEAIKHIPNFTPDILHCNDWHTGMVPVLLKAFYKNNPKYKNIKTVFTIHNLRYQGVFSKDILGELLGLDNSYFSEDKLKFYDGVSFMKGGLIYSDVVTTVSETYAKEITYPFYGEKLNGLIMQLGNKVHGIVNGIDYNLYDPRKDTKIYENFGLTNLKKKVKNKTELQKRLGLPIDENIMMVGLVSRLVSQKGLDLIKWVMDEILNINLQFVVLGTGDTQYQDLFNYYSYTHPDKISANITFSDELARKIYAACDVFLMPSLFEPCGIGQLIAMRYGSIPLVRETGGLKDTVTNFDPETKVGTGFVFQNYNAHDMLFKLEYIAKIFYEDKKSWTTLMKSCMKYDGDWKESAKKYKALYGGLL